MVLHRPFTKYNQFERFCSKKVQVAVTLKTEEVIIFL